MEAITMHPPKTLGSDQIHDLLLRMDAKLNLLLRLEGTAPPEIAVNNSNSADVIFWSNFTPRHHAIIQMMLRGASIDEISSRLSISPNTTKTHMAMIVRKLDVSRKSIAIPKLLSAFDRISPDAYLQASRGIPKDWDANYSDDHPANVLLRLRGERDA